MRNYEHRMWRTETSQPIKDESYPYLPSKPIRDEVDYVTVTRVAMYSKRSVVKASECDSVAKKSCIIYHDGKEDGVICRMDRSRTLLTCVECEIACINCKYRNEECKWNKAISATCNRKSDGSERDMKPNSLTLRFSSLYADFF